MHRSLSGEGDGRETGAASVALLDKLQTTMHAIIVPVHPALRMFFYAASLDDNVRVYHFATAWAEPDWGVVAPVIHVLTPLPSHFGYLPNPKRLSGGTRNETRTPCSRAVCNLIHMVMRARAIGKMNLENAEAPMPTAG